MPPANNFWLKRLCELCEKYFNLRLDLLKLIFERGVETIFIESVQIECILRIYIFIFTLQPLGFAPAVAETGRDPGLLVRARSLFDLAIRIAQAILTRIIAACIFEGQVHIKRVAELAIQFAQNAVTHGGIAGKTAVTPQIVAVIG